jgi:hypothetical protein
MMGPLVVLASLIGVFWLALGRPKVRRDIRCVCTDHSRRHWRKFLLFAAAALGAAGLARQAFLLVGLIMGMLVIAVVTAFVLVRRRRRRFLGSSATRRYPQ